MDPADLRREADALRLAAGERGGRAFEREVVEPDFDEELQASADLLHDLARDRLLAFAERRLRAREARGPLVRLDDAHARDIDDVQRIDGDSERLRLERAPLHVGQGVAAM
jgi:hypothetical protein